MTSQLLWLRGFACTLLVEELVAVPLLRRAEASLGKRALAVLVANIATHPLVWFFFPHLGWPWGSVVIVAESWALGFEIVVYALVFARAPLSQCVAASALANAASYVVGLLAVRWGLFG